MINDTMLSSSNNNNNKTHFVAGDEIRWTLFGNVDRRRLFKEQDTGCDTEDEEVV